MRNNFFSSTKDSSLADYGYDMVLAVTQKSLNATLCEYLGKLKDEVKTSCYTVQLNDDLLPEYCESNYEEIKQELGKDLFEINVKPSERTEEEQKILEKAYNEKHFSFAVRYKYGFIPQAVPQIIELSDKNGSYERQKVYYNMHFKQFEIIELSSFYGTLVLNKIVQQPDEPFIFKTQVNLSMENLTKSDAPEELKRMLKNMGVNMFSFQQLFLDINTAKIQSLPKLTGMDESSPAYVLITSRFINQCWKEMHANGKVVFHYAVKPQLNSSDPNPSLIPTDFDFCISPYRPKGTDPKDQGLYTLNYLVMSENRILPEISEFNWNWIEKDEQNIHGSIAINHERFIPRIISVFHNVIAGYVKPPRVRLTCYLRGGQYRNVMFIEFSNERPACSYKKTGPVEWQLDYTGSHSAEGFVGLLDRKVADLIGTYSVKSNIKLAGKKLIHELTVTYHINLTHKGNTAKGDLFKLEDRSEYVLEVDNRGRISFNKANSASAQVTGYLDNPKKLRLSVDKNGGELSVEDFRRTKGAEVLDSFKALAGQLNTDLKNTLSNMDKIWIFPGTQTFLFKNSLFSDTGDLTAHLNYKKPQ